VSFLGHDGGHLLDRIIPAVPLLLELEMEAIQKQPPLCGFENNL
jgi:hypothetical protein